MARAIEQVRGAAAQRDVDLEVAPGPSATLQGDEDVLLERLPSPLDNVTELKYDCPGVGLAREEPPGGHPDLVGN